MIRWARRYSGLLEWLARVAVVVVLSCVPRCAWAGETTYVGGALGVSVGSNYIYWTGNPGGKIRRATLDAIPPGYVGAATSTSVITSTDVSWVALPDHSHPLMFPYGAGGGGWTTAPMPPAPDTWPWWWGAIPGGGVGTLWCWLGRRSKRRRALPAQRLYRCRLCRETAMGGDVGTATVAHILATTCNGDMEDEPVRVPCTAHRGASEIADKELRQALGGVAGRALDKIMRLQ
jgi:hypothetical protein